LSVLVGTLGWRVSFAALGIVSFVVALFVGGRSCRRSCAAAEPRAVVSGVQSAALCWLTLATALTNIGSMVMLRFHRADRESRARYQRIGAAALFFYRRYVADRQCGVRMVRRLAQSQSPTSQHRLD
jgi:predicted MFS family arabinose efflux permease